MAATAGFFGAHSKAQASSRYNLFYYGGSSAIGWLGGLAFDAHGWPAVAVTILACAGFAVALAAMLPGDE